MDKMVDAKYLANIMGYTPQRIAQLAKKGDIPAVKRGRKWFFNPSVVIGQMTASNNAPTPKKDEKIKLG